MTGPSSIQTTSSSLVTVIIPNQPTVTGQPGPLSGTSVAITPLGPGGTGVPATGTVTPRPTRRPRPFRFGPPFGRPPFGRPPFGRPGPPGRGPRPPFGLSYDDLIDLLNYYFGYPGEEDVDPTASTTGGNIGPIGGVPTGTASPIGPNGGTPTGNNGPAASVPAGTPAGNVPNAGTPGGGIGLDVGTPVGGIGVSVGLPGGLPAGTNVPTAGTPGGTPGAGIGLDLGTPIGGVGVSIGLPGGLPAGTNVPNAGTPGGTPGANIGPIGGIPTVIPSVTPIGPIGGTPTGKATGTPTGPNNGAVGNPAGPNCYDYYYYDPADDWDNYFWVWVYPGEPGYNEAFDALSGTEFDPTIIWLNTCININIGIK